VARSFEQRDAPRLGVYIDYRFRRTDLGVSGERAFVLFLFALEPHVGSLTLIGRFDPSPEPYPYVLPASVGLVELPFYVSLAHPGAAAGGLLRGAVTAWKALDQLDVLWTLGPNPMSIVIATMGLLRGKRVVLGVRQDSRAYVRRRHPGRRTFWLAADIMQAAFRALARRCPIAVVGADLAEQFPDARELQPFHVSLVAEADVRSEDPPERAIFARRILTVGRLDAEKNPLLLAEAMACLAADGDGHPPWRLDVYGEGPLERELARRIAELGLQDVITLRGYVGIDAGLRDAYDRADAFLHVSWTEGMPQVLIEAFAARLPTVATDVGGVAALAGDGALLVAPGDAQAVADALRRLGDDEGLRTRLVEAGTVIVRAHTTEAEARALASFLTGGPA
jgi:glycosyltransferase involved in cell wall biosynthesis